MTLPSILIAGGAGYIGSHTAMLLKQSGYEPVVIDNLVTGNRFATRFGPFIEGNIEDFELVRSVVRQHDCKAAILLAAHAYVGESVTDPRKYYHNNVTASLRFLDALMAEDVRAVVYSSSCSVYGVQAAMPIDEHSPKNPLSPYAETKAFLEQVLRWYGSAYGIRSVCLRYFNAAGADAGCALGESHDPETHLIPRAIYAALGRDRLQIFGSDYETRDGTALRDYIHVTDLAVAHLRAVERLVDGGRSLTVNLVRERATRFSKPSGWLNAFPGAPYRWNLVRDVKATLQNW